MTTRSKKTRTLVCATRAVILAAALVGCIDSTAPVVARSATLETSARTNAASRRDDNGQPAEAHAIHVRLTSMVFGAVVIDEYTFHVKDFDNDVKGKFYLTQRRVINGVEQAVVVASGPMECVTVVGNKAKAGGRVDYSTFPAGIPVGSELTWSVTDEGSSSKADDTASEPLGNNARAYCAAGSAYPERPVERGKITVKG